MIVECDLQNLLLSLNIEEERRKRIKQREEQIKYEFSLYRCFCKLFYLKPCNLNSYKLFLTYCEENQITLL